MNLKEKNSGEFQQNSRANSRNDKIHVNIFSTLQRQSSKPSVFHSEEQNELERKFQERFLNKRWAEGKSLRNLREDRDLNQKTRSNFSEHQPSERNERIMEKLPASQNYFLINLEHIKKKKKRNPEYDSIIPNLKKITQYETNVNTLQLCDLNTLDEHVKKEQRVKFKKTITFIKKKEKMTVDNGKLYLFPYFICSYHN